MYYVYFLKSYKNGSIYIGYSSDLKERLKLHNSSKVESTKNAIPWELIYYEAFKNQKDATHREKMLKQDGRSRTWLKKRLHESLKKGSAREA